jgi:glutathione S-transferase
MIDLYYWTTPNGHKITIFLEEAALAYKIVPVNGYPMETREILLKADKDQSSRENV